MSLFAIINQSTRVRTVRRDAMKYRSFSLGIYESARFKLAQTKIKNNNYNKIGEYNLIFSLFECQLEMFTQPNKYFAYYFSAIHICIIIKRIYTYILGPALKHHITLFNRARVYIMKYIENFSLLLTPAHS